MKKSEQDAAPNTAGAMSHLELQHFATARRVGELNRSAKIYTMRKLIIMAAFLSSIGRLFGGADKPPYELAEVYTGMREQVLKLSDKDITELKGKPVWAVLMETGHDGAAVTVVAVAEGTASLYFSNGGGMIGLGAHENVRPAALSLVKAAEPQLKHMKKTEKFPVPKPGETFFYVVTPDGVFTYSAKEDDLGNKRDKLFPLFFEGHELITQMRIADEKRQAEQDGADQPATAPESKLEGKEKLKSESEGRSQ